MLSVGSPLRHLPRQPDRLFGHHMMSATTRPASAPRETCSAPAFFYFPASRLMRPSKRGEPTPSSTHRIVRAPPDDLRAVGHFRLDAQAGGQPSTYMTMSDTRWIGSFRSYTEEVPGTVE